jgi:acyl-CoA reductase-like NAD-dependent aldehyde dehydrogenase
MPTLVSASTELDPRVVDFVSGPKQMYVDGQWVDALSGRRFDTVDPATEQVITTVPQSGAEDVERAVRAARRAFEGGPWPAMTPAERQRLVWRIGEGITARADVFAQLETIDNGKSVARAGRGRLAAGFTRSRCASPSGCAPRSCRGTSRW